jgi:hypothetical protein
LISHHGDPGSMTGQVVWNLYLRKCQWGGFSPNTPVSPASFHFPNCSLLVYHSRLPIIFLRPLLSCCPTHLCRPTLLFSHHQDYYVIDIAQCSSVALVSLGSVLITLSSVCQGPGIQTTRSLLVRHYATSRKVAGSRHDEAN